MPLRGTSQLTLAHAHHAAYGYDLPAALPPRAATGAVELAEECQVVVWRLVKTGDAAKLCQKV